MDDSLHTQPNGIAPAATSGTKSAALPPRFAIIAALVLGLAFVVGVLGAAKILMNRQVYQPVAMGTVDAPDAPTLECRTMIDALPQELADLRRVKLADPAPEGAAAYRTKSGEEVTLRCGVHVPTQYTLASPVQEQAGVKWLEVADATPGSTLHSWYAVSHDPLLVVTSTVGRDLMSAAIAELSPVVRDHGQSSGAPRPQAFPLSAGGAQRPVAACGKFLAGLPQRLGVYEQAGAEQRAGVQVPENTRWYLPDAQHPGVEPLVVRCGVDQPRGYRPGVQLNQVNEVPWYFDSSLAAGSTAGRFYGLGFAEVVAVSAPQDQSADVLPVISDRMREDLRRSGGAAVPRR